MKKIIIKHQKTTYGKISVFLLAMMLFASCENKNAEKSTQKQETMKTMHLTKEEFISKVADYEKNPSEWKYLGEKPAIIDFYATWCGPCRSIAPILEELAEEYKDQIVIYKVDTDKEQELSAVFGIRSIPTLIFVPMEGNPTILQGAMSKTNFEKAINEILLVKQEQ